MTDTSWSDVLAYLRKDWGGLQCLHCDTVFATDAEIARIIVYDRDQDGRVAGYSVECVACRQKQEAFLAQLEHTPPQ